jgi:hypothetical protein
MFEQEGKKLNHNIVPREYNVKKRIDGDDICHAIAKCEQQVKQRLNLQQESDDETTVKPSPSKSFADVR